MKVILTRGFEKLGNVGNILNVKDGYAKNFLIPKGIAVAATKGNIKQMGIVKKSIMKKEAKNIEQAEQVAERLKDLEIDFKVKTGSEGKLYGSITSKDIADRILNERKVEIDKKKIELDDHLKELGTYDVEIKLYKDVKSKVKVVIESDSKSEEDDKEGGDKSEEDKDSIEGKSKIKNDVENEGKIEDKKG